MPSYLEDLSPGAGRRSPARSWLPSDAPSSASTGLAVPLVSGRHRAWTTGPPIRTSTTATGTRSRCPSHWVLPARDGPYGQPIYTNVQYPFPIDPPHVPDENPTGDHRRTFDLPDWQCERVLLRFDGVESIYRVWLNGDGGRDRQRQPAGPGVRRHRSGPARRQRDLGPGAPVVVDELPRRSRSVVAAGHLPRRHAARPAGGRDRRSLAAHRVRADGTGSIDPEVIAGRRRLPDRDRDPRTRRDADLRLDRARRRASTAGRSSRGAPNASAVRSPRPVGRRDDHPADRLPQRVDRGRPAVWSTAPSPPSAG